MKPVKVEDGLDWQEGPADAKASDSRMLVPRMSFEVRTRFFIAQCKALQFARRNWSLSRPCCLANAFLEPPLPPPGDGRACFERLTAAQTARFRAYVQAVEVRGELRGHSESAHFKRLVRPELLMGMPASTPEGGSGRTLARSSSGAIAVPQPQAAKRRRISEKSQDKMREAQGGMRRARFNEHFLSLPYPKPDSVVPPPRSAPVPCAQEAAKAPLCSSSGSVAASLSDAALRRASQGAGCATRKVIARQGKQSGVRNISWTPAMNSWRVRWTEAGKAKVKEHFVHRYMKCGSKSYGEADAEALRDAIAFREDLVRKGVLKATKGKAGVSWTRASRSWRVELAVGGGKKVQGGSFRPKDDTPEEVERARLAALECRRNLMLKLGIQIEEREVVNPDKIPRQTSNVRGVTWDCHGCHWRAKPYVNGRQLHKSFKPTDYTPEAIEVARLAAVKWASDVKGKPVDMGAQT
mmetsp:Transcript_12674/g.40537  ORF Transcript_12674/g.40537 Transcript_12674/m.40537 type:complete len:467 (+) Transcript_12674:195-1595(+)